MANGEPVPVNPEPVPVNPEPLPINPEPLPINPQPVSANPDDDKVVIPPEPKEAEVEEPLTLVEDSGVSGMSKIKARAAGSPLDQEKKDYKRNLNITGHGATRCRLFHSRISLTSLQHMETAINEWVDDDEIERRIGTLFHQF